MRPVCRSFCVTAFFARRAVSLFGNKAFLSFFVCNKSIKGKAACQRRGFPGQGQLAGWRDRLNRGTRKGKGALQGSVGIVGARQSKENARPSSTAPKDAAALRRYRLLRRLWRRQRRKEPRPKRLAAFRPPFIFRGTLSGKIPQAQKARMLFLTCRRSSSILWPVIL